MRFAATFVGAGVESSSSLLEFQVLVLAMLVASWAFAYACCCGGWFVVGHYCRACTGWYVEKFPMSEADSRLELVMVSQAKWRCVNVAVLHSTVWIGEKN